jgi:hypothetical protein
MPEVFPTRFTLPMTRESRYTTRVNRMPDFTEARTADQVSPLFRWDLQLGPLSDADAATIQSFYAARNGGYETFAFLDPLDNLLQWSEDFSQSAWQKSNPSSFAVSGGVTDPFGGSAAQTLSNSSGATNTVSQTLVANPAGITFTASVWLQGSGNVTLRVTDGAGQTASTVAALSGSWKRYVVTGNFPSAGTQIIWSADLAASAGANFFGAQLVPLQGPGAYTRTTVVSGFHPNCCFDSGLTHRVVSPGVNQMKVSVIEHS